MAKERLDKILASQNVGSRRDVGVMIRRGCVAVNGQVVKKADCKADPSLDRIAVNGEELQFQRFVYYMMNKPGGVLSAARDSRAETVLDLLPPELFRRGLFPAGRLDRDTEGLLIITDDGDFAHRMLAPKSHVHKIYHAGLDKPISQDDVEAFHLGLELNDMTCMPAELAALDKDGFFAQIKLCEGKFHQVKRMFLARNITVLSLKRVQIGRLVLDLSLTAGQARPLTQDEQKSIFL